MRTFIRPVLVTWAVALVLAGGAQVGSAGRLGFNERGFALEWQLFSTTAAGATVTCNVRLSGSFHLVLVRKLIGSLLGYIQSASIGSCVGGTATFLTETLPWHVQYEFFSGTLPNITSVHMAIVGLAVRVHPEGLPECLAGTTQSRPAEFAAELSAGSVIWARLNATRIIPLGGGFLCSLAGNATFSGTGSMTTATAATFRMSLI